MVLPRFSRAVLGLAATVLGASGWAAETLYVAQPLTGPIGTIKLEGPAADKSGGLYVCSVQQEGLTFTWKSSSRGNVAYVNARGEVKIVATLDEGQRGNGARLVPDGRLLVADQVGGEVLLVDPKRGTVETYFKFPEGSGSPNDLAVRRDGVVYVSFFNDGLWMITPGNRVGTKVGNGFHNGIDLSPDETRLHSEKKTYDVAADGSLSNPRALLQVPSNDEGFSYTDGIRCDAAGNIYMARFGGREDPADNKSPRKNGVIHMFAPDGRLIRNIEVLDTNVTNLTFGGPDGRTVFVTHPGPKGFISSFRSEFPGREPR